MATAVTGKSSGGKGNLGMFIERDAKIRAAGLPAPMEQRVKDNLKCYTLQDKVDALIGDAIKPLSSSVHKSLITRHKVQDMRNAGVFSEGAKLINPPVKTKFQTLEEDFKNTNYNSYWNKQVGKPPDHVPMLPQGFKIYETTLGKKNQFSSTLYEVIMPVDTVPDSIPASKKPGYQTTRNYRSFNPNATFGKKSVSDISVKHCLTYNKWILGTGLKVPISEKQAYFQDSTTSKLGVALTPNKNIKCVPEGFAFGKVESYYNDLPEFLRICEMNSHKELLIKCLGYLNSLRNSLSKRFDGSFFKTFYLNLKYLDESKNGWLEKQVIYDQCQIRYIRCNPSLIEPLLQIWNAFDGSRIDYKLFIRIIDFREPSPELPKIHDSLERYVDFTTTYSELGNNNVITEQQYRAGVPSGRYLDKDYPRTPSGFCKADRIYLPEETDMKACLMPSVFTLLGISHRDMYAKRDAATIRKIFKNAGEKFEDEKFNEIWKMAQKCHSQEWVCLETFRRSLIEYEKENTRKIK